MKVVIEASEQELIKAKKDLSDISTLAYQMCLMSNLKTANVIADERRFWKKAYQLTLSIQRNLAVCIKKGESDETNTAKSKVSYQTMERFQSKTERF